MNTLPIAPECLAAAKAIADRYPDAFHLDREKGEQEYAQIIQDHLSMVLLESREYRWVVQELMWMHDDKTLGLKPGDRFTIEGIRALRKERDDYLKRLIDMGDRPYRT